MKPRWKRIDKITPKQKAALEKLTKQTPGMSMYGNRARTSVMLPVEVAMIISERVADEKITVSELIVNLIEKGLKK
jgi:hypothetical protein